MGCLMGGFEPTTPREITFASRGRHAGLFQLSSFSRAECEKPFPTSHFTSRRQWEKPFYFAPFGRFFSGTGDKVRGDYLRSLSATKETEANRAS